MAVEFFATTLVVPEPKNGSNTTSPFEELASIILAISFSDFCVGCAVFSAIDQKEIVISSQKFEGQVSR